MEACQKFCHHVTFPFSGFLLYFNHSSGSPFHRGGEGRAGAKEGERAQPAGEGYQVTCGAFSNIIWPQ